jgi:hypothetical protein
MTNKQMKKLRKIDIGGRNFKVKVYKKQPKDIIEELGECAGWCDWVVGIIGIVDRSGENTLTLFHEIGHAAADSVKANNPLSNETFARPFFAVFYAALKEAGMIK